MPELVLLPGLAQDGRAFDLTGLPGTPGLRVRTWVYPGHGGREVRRVSVEEMADELADALAGRGRDADEPVDVAGVALGGIVAQHLMVRHPERVRSAVLACTTPGVGDRDALRRRALDTGGAGMEAITPSLLDRWFRGSSVAADSPGVRYMRRTLADADLDGYVATQLAMADHGTEQALPGLDQPVTLLTGADDAVGPGSIEALHRLLRRSRVVPPIPGSHMVHLDNPEGFRDVVLDHLDWVENGAPSPVAGEVGAG